MGDGQKEEMGKVLGGDSGRGVASCGDELYEGRQEYVSVLALVVVVAVVVVVVKVLMVIAMVAVEETKKKEEEEETWRMGAGGGGGGGGKRRRCGRFWVGTGEVGWLAAVVNCMKRDRSMFWC